MSYSMDLRKRVVEFVRGGGSKAEAHRRFQVSLWCVNDWVKREDDLSPRQTGPKKSHKLDWKKLRHAVEVKPDAMLKEHAKKFGTSITAIWYALRQTGLSRKKNDALQAKKEV